MMNYLNTRIAMMRSELMPRSDVEDLLAAGDVRSFLDRLLNSPYGQALSERLASASPRNAVNHALTHHMGACFKHILTIAPWDVRSDVEALFARVEVQAIKSVLRGLHVGLPPQSIREAAGTGSRLTEAQITILSEESDVAAAVGQLATWKHPYGAILSRSLQAYRETNDPLILENALDRLRYDVPKAHPAAELIALEAEIRNIVNALNALGQDKKPAILNQGNHSTRLITELHSAHHPSEAIAFLADSRFNTILDKALPMLLMNQDRFYLFERMLDEALIKEVGRMALLEPDSLAVPYHYMLLKWNEVMNVRLIGIGLMDGLQANVIRGALVFKEAA